MSTTGDDTAFARATAVTGQGDGRYAAVVDGGWDAPTGPNGGYLAAIVVRALEAELARDGERRLRSLTLHYLRRPELGPIDVEIRVLRAGRRTATATVTTRQDGRELQVGVAGLAVPGLETAVEWTPSPPDAGPPPAADAPAIAAGDYRREAGAWIAPFPGMPPIVSQLRLSPRIGGVPLSGRLPRDGAAAETGGWIGSPEEQPIDAAYVAQLTDFWWPPAFEAVDRPVAAPTLDLTIHFRADLPPGGLPAAPVLGHYRSAAATEGLVGEDADLYLPDGTLLAQSRQLALLAPVAT